MTKNHDKKFLLFYDKKEQGEEMLEPALENKLNYDLTSKSAFSSENETFTSRSFAALLAKNEVPLSHKNIADNYMVIKRVFKFQLGLGRISNVEKALLEKHNFKTLEFITTEQMYKELSLLQQWSMSTDEQTKTDSDSILQIRVKELKFLESNRYTINSNELHNGYKALEQYLHEISRFHGSKVI